MKHTPPPLTALRGVGGKTLERLERLGLHTLHDLVFHLPLRYEDRTVIKGINQLRHGDFALIEGYIETVEEQGIRQHSLVCYLNDGNASIGLRFFHYSAAQRERMRTGVLLRCFGEVREAGYGRAGKEMTHPEYREVASGEQGRIEASLTPVYPSTDGLQQRLLRRLIQDALTYYRDDSVAASALTDWLPRRVVDGLAFPALFDAIQTLHSPPPGSDSADSINQAQQRLAFEELLAHHLSLSRFKISRTRRAPLMRPNAVLEQAFSAVLPFHMTAAQQRVIAEIERDLAGEKPMMRLLQGDVGSGKTVVAARAALIAVASGFQVAIMAPTELLAEQHYQTFLRWLTPLGVNVGFLSGRQKASERETVLFALGSGLVNIVLGTHALFQESVIFQRLGLVIIDEQHRFGVHQRLALKEKGGRDGNCPHQLVMTATPIPRTLAMLGYADLDVSVIDELPPGRKPVQTVAMPSSRRGEVVQRIHDWVGQRRQAYWVCTLIEESELLSCQAAEQTAQALTAALPGVRVALIHGRMRAAQKEQAMQDFKSGLYDLLVATTVIEVGVDVPNAGLMVIENPERLGLSQLHQLRGRVGRGEGESFCVLLYQSPLSVTAKQRLGILRATQDGFVIAEKDLELRGPGEFLGVRQTGLMQFRVADLIRDSGLLDDVKTVAEDLLRDEPECVEPLISRWLGQGARYAEV
ncbi:ATP-dependent DNA helicase RecG [Candidatus Methylospira mobilis]|uniref:ATP-dependent DNA helicase RecG n=1 Tax=Candidatus Methylospira mobilis TaxID=1808979 RepID=UPI001D17A950|nr:ATP-dependent DNA helicase RecG [Candidatus Methylospira mobilis]